jgi:hypothetical protein
VGWHADGCRVSIATDNDFHWTNDMLGRPMPERSFRTSFDDWWNAQSSEFHSRVDDLAAWSGFKRDTLQVTKRPCAASPTEWAASASRCGQRAQPSKEDSDHGD